MRLLRLFFLLAIPLVNDAAQHDYVAEVVEVVQDTQSMIRGGSMSDERDQHGRKLSTINWSWTNLLCKPFISKIAIADSTQCAAHLLDLWFCLLVIEQFTWVCVMHKPTARTIPIPDHADVRIATSLTHLISKTTIAKIWRLPACRPKKKTCRRAILLKTVPRAVTVKMAVAYSGCLCLSRWLRRPPPVVLPS
jgi:hypothetical protein